MTLSLSSSFLESFDLVLKDIDSNEMPELYGHLLDLKQCETRKDLALHLRRCSKLDLGQFELITRENLHILFKELCFLFTSLEPSSDDLEMAMEPISGKKKAVFLSINFDKPLLSLIDKIHPLIDSYLVTLFVTDSIRSTEQLFPTETLSNVHVWMLCRLFMVLQSNCVNVCRNDHEITCKVYHLLNNVLQMVFHTVKRFPNMSHDQPLRVLGMVVQQFSHLRYQAESEENKTEIASITKSFALLLSMSSLHKDCVTKSAVGLIDGLQGLFVNKTDLAQCIFRGMFKKVCIMDGVCLGKQRPLARLALFVAILSVFGSDADYSLFQEITEEILVHCASSDSALRLYALQTLSRAIKKLVKICKQQDMFHVLTNLPERILNVLVVNWDHRFNAIVKSLRPLFSEYLSLHELISGNSSDGKLWLDFASKLVALPDGHRSKYEMIALLLPKLSKNDQLILFVTSNPTLLPQLFEYSSDNRISNSSNRLLDHLLQSLRFASKDVEEWKRFWFTSFVDALTVESAPTCNYLEHTLLPNLIRQDTCIVNDLIRANLCVKSHLNVLLKAKSLNLFYLFGDNSEMALKLMESVKSALFGFNDEHRLLAFELLVSSKKSTELFIDSEMQLIQSALPFFMKIQEQSVRDRFLHLFKFLLTRILDAIAKSSRSDDFMENPQVLLNFLCPAKFHSFLIGQVYPGSPVERMSTVFESLLLIHSVIKTSAHSLLWQNQISRMKGSLWNARYSIWFSMVTSWDQIRLLGSKLVRRMAFHNEVTKELEEMFQWASQMSLRTRLRDAESGAFICSSMVDLITMSHGIVIETGLFLGDTSSRTKHVFELIEESCKIIEERSRTFSNALVGGVIEPFHGKAIFVRELLNLVSWRKCIEIAKSDENFCKVIYQVFQFCAKSVINALRNCSVVAASEDDEIMDCRGHLILADQSSEHFVVNGWLSTKECSSLLAKIVQMHLSNDYPNLFQDADAKDIIKEIGNALIDVLLHSKHNGSIQKTHLSFCEIATALLKHQEMEDLVTYWLDHLLDIVKGDQIRSNAWIRRSAGLPYGFLAILHAEPSKTNRILLSKTMTTLLEYSREDDFETKVHSLNILRALMRDREFSVNLTHFVADSLIQAVCGFSHENWPVRNSSLMLFSAIMTSALSMDQNLSIQQFFHQYPVLLDFLKKTLSNSIRNKESHTIFPILLLLSKLKPCHDFRDDQLTSLLMDCLIGDEICDFFGIRRKAGEALISATPIDRIDLLLSDTIDRIPKSAKDSKNVSSNSIHGLLMLLTTAVELGYIFDTDLLWILNSDFCDMVQEQVVILCSLQLKTSRDNAKRKAFINALVQLVVDLKDTCITRINGKRLLRTALKSLFTEISHLSSEEVEYISLFALFDHGDVFFRNHFIETLELTLDHSFHLINAIHWIEHIINLLKSPPSDDIRYPSFIKFANRLIGFHEIPGDLLDQLIYSVLTFCSQCSTVSVLRESLYLIGVSLNVLQGHIRLRHVELYKNMLIRLSSYEQTVTLRLACFESFKQSVLPMSLFPQFASFLSRGLEDESPEIRETASSLCSSNESTRHIVLSYASLLEKCELNDLVDFALMKLPKQVETAGLYDWKASDKELFEREKYNDFKENLLEMQVMCSTIKSKMLLTPSILQKQKLETLSKRLASIVDSITLQQNQSTSIFNANLFEIIYSVLVFALSIKGYRKISVSPLRTIVEKHHLLSCMLSFLEEDDDIPWKKVLFLLPQGSE